MSQKGKRKYFLSYHNLKKKKESIYIYTQYTYIHTPLQMIFALQGLLKVGVRIFKKKKTPKGINK